MAWLQSADDGMSGFQRNNFPRIYRFWSPKFCMISPSHKIVFVNDELKSPKLRLFSEFCFYNIVIQKIIMYIQSFTIHVVFENMHWQICLNLFLKKKCKLSNQSRIDSVQITNFKFWAIEHQIFRNHSFRSSLK